MQEKTKTMLAKLWLQLVLGIVLSFLLFLLVEGLFWSTKATLYIIGVTLMISLTVASIVILDDEDDGSVGW